MSRTVSVTCTQCGAANEVLASDGSFEDQLAHASFHFACRECGVDLPPISSDAPPLPPEAGPGRGSV